LYCAALKKQRMKLLLEKATELGVAKIVLVSTQNTNAEYDAIPAGFDRLCIESAEQCERLDIPQLSGLLPFKELMDQFSATSSSSSSSGGSAGSSSSSSADSSFSSTPTESSLLVCRERFPGGLPLLTAIEESRLLMPSSAREGPILQDRKQRTVSVFIGTCHYHSLYDANVLY
jgi:hypothetical protein